MDDCGIAPVENAYVAWLVCPVELVNGKIAEDELEAAIEDVDDVVSLATTMLEDGGTEELRLPTLDVLFTTAPSDAEEVAVLASGWLVATMLLFEDSTVLDDWDEVVEFRRAALVPEDVVLGVTTVLEFEIDCATLFSVPSDVAVLETALDPAIDVLLLGTITVLEDGATIEVEFDAARAELVVERTELLLAKTTVFEVEDDARTEVLLDTVDIELVVEDRELLTARSAVFASVAEEDVALVVAVRLVTDAEGSVLLLADAAVLEDDTIEEVVFNAMGLDVVAAETTDEVCEEVETLAATEIDPVDEVEFNEAEDDPVGDGFRGLATEEVDEETGTTTDVLDDDAEAEELETTAWYVLCADGVS